ncbi:MAG: Hpt domain-containing protein [Oleiphilaceae bacterium]|nr:Hpt domain-containing protein [Oleiphilaceae bacterium]
MTNGDHEAPDPLDMHKLNESFMQNTDVIKTILNAFRDSFGDFEEQFRQAEVQGDKEYMSRLAHSIKGSAGNIRAGKLADCAANLEQQIHQANQDQIHQSFDELLESLDELNHYIDDFTRK